MKQPSKVQRTVNCRLSTVDCPSLRRELTLTNGTAIVVANMIGAGIFGITGFLAGDLGKPSLVLGIWLAGALVALAGCLCYAEMAINLPRSGGEYVYLREAWGPAWGFLSGWISFFAGFAAPIAAAALLFSEYLAHFYPALSPRSTQGLLSTSSRWIHTGNGHLLAVGVVAVFAVVNILGVRFAGKIQNVLTGLKVGVLGAFLLLAFGVGKGSGSHFSEVAVRTSHHSLAGQFAVSLIFVMFAYSGWNAATYVAEEMQAPERTLPALLVVGTLIVAAFYLALNAAFIYALPLEAMKGIERIGGAAAVALFGRKGGDFFSGVMSIGLLSTVCAMVIVGPRVYYAMAQDGCFFRGAARVHPHWRTPVHAILWQSLATVVMILTGTFESLLYYIGFALILFAALAVAGLVRLRHRPAWKRLGAVSWGYPLAPIVFIAASVWMLGYTMVLRPRESFLGLLTLAGGALVYYSFFRRHAGGEELKAKG
jgi:APA family basic amino acid/polyamine antiporter